MKPPTWLIVVFGISAIGTAHHCQSQVLLWQPLPLQEVEFGVTAMSDGVFIQAPSALEDGYNGAWWWGNSEDGLTYGMAQTFLVPSSRTLKSIQLRVGRFDFEQPSGEFEVAIYRFDSQSGTPAERLAAVLANAEDYPFVLTSVPVSSFDFSGCNLALKPSETYALAVTPTATFSGGLMTLQAATDIYTVGSAYFLHSAVPAVPESNKGTLFVSVAVGLFLIAGRRQMRALARRA
jgi:hypothetical protein